MGSPYPIELRDRVVGAMRRGMSSYEAAEHFEVSQSSAMRWFHRADQMGSPAALPMGGKRPFVLAAHRDWVLGRIAAQPDIVLRALLAELHERGVAVSYFGLWHLVKRAGLSFKKNSARQRTRPAGRGTAARKVA